MTSGAWPGLLGARKEELRHHGAGPHKADDAVATYLGAEQDLGRLRSETDLTAAAGLLLGACSQYAFLSHMSLSGDRDDDEAADQSPATSSSNSPNEVACWRLDSNMAG
ncbi:TetR/AcrR family transcriptional regulator C-terminal domain-containing protein [Nonomuraea sp. CA-143628]|uniref:TetR/AcrR family transcriptional regulator C-terminal domain-containing protein n=1 Tax=Nonomuraea sp. CA-143628 TaxID=3239997 RepID=UPI003D8DC26D